MCYLLQKIKECNKNNMLYLQLPENPAELMYIVVSAINQTECRNRMNHIYKHKLKHHKNLTDNLVPENLCTRQDKGEGRNSTDSGQDSCQGDSGGPLLLQEGKGHGPWVDPPSAAILWLFKSNVLNDWFLGSACWSCQLGSQLCLERCPGRLCRCTQVCRLDWRGNEEALTFIIEGTSHLTGLFRLPAN